MKTEKLPPLNQEKLQDTLRPKGGRGRGPRLTLSSQWGLLCGEAERRSARRQGRGNSCHARGPGGQLVPRGRLIRPSRVELTLKSASMDRTERLIIPREQSQLFLHICLSFYLTMFRTVRNNISVYLVFPPKTEKKLKSGKCVKHSHIHIYHAHT